VGCEAAKAGWRLIVSPNARPLPTQNANEWHEEYAVGVGKRLRMLFGRGGCFLHCDRCGGLRWRLSIEADAHGKYDFSSAAKPASARDAPPNSQSKTRRLRKGIATPLRFFGIVGATSSCRSHA
jgi:hypothetical protein